MFKKFFYISALLLLVNCSMPSSAFLGPVFTGARTGSVYQASLSYGTSKVMNEIKQIEVFAKSNAFSLNETKVDKDPVIVLTYVVDNIKISNVLEPEPLP